MVETSSPNLSDNPGVIVPLLTINTWLLMQRNVQGGVVSLTKNWVEYRGGIGAPTGTDNYWLGLDKIYRITQLGSLRLRVEVQKLKRNASVFFLLIVILKECYFFTRQAVGIEHHSRHLKQPSLSRDS